MNPDLDAPVDVDVPRADVRAAQPGQGAPDTRALRLLVAEDDRDMRELIGIVLRALPDAAEVVTVENAVAAMDVLEDNAVALLVTDLRMPGADGLDVLRFARPNGWQVVAAFGTEPFELGSDAERVVLSSLPLVGGALPGEATAWIAPGV